MSMKPHTTRSMQNALAQSSLTVQRWQGATSHAARDELATEEPLEVRIAATEQPQTVAVIMRTPGHDEELALGFLFSEGLLVDRREVARLTFGADADGLPSPNALDLVPSPDADIVRRIENDGYSRAFAVNTSCGVCGKNTVTQACAALTPIAVRPGLVAAHTLYALPERLRTGQAVFTATGGLHAAGIFAADGALLSLREDIGRHNAVDKLIGRALLDDALPLGDHVLMVSGRVSYEIVLKALSAGIPLIAGVSAPSSLAVDLAHAAGITLAGFLRAETMNVYTHPERVATR
jgi:FdhD protein